METPPEAQIAPVGDFSPPIDPITISQREHGYGAVDFVAPTGTRIMAFQKGTVVVSREGGWNGGFGSYIVLSHEGFQTLYAHLSLVLVKAGDFVRQGTAIGYSGDSGKVTGPHLHFEVRGRRNPWASSYSPEEKKIVTCVELAGASTIESNTTPNIGLIMLYKNHNLYDHSVIVSIISSGFVVAEGTVEDCSWAVVPYDDNRIRGFYRL